MSATKGNFLFNNKKKVIAIGEMIKQGKSDLLDVNIKNKIKKIGMNHYLFEKQQ